MGMSEFQRGVEAAMSVARSHYLQARGLAAGAHQARNDADRRTYEDMAREALDIQEDIAALLPIRALAREPETQGWRDISTAPRGEVLLFYPETPSGRNHLRAWVTVGHAGSTHRKPTHWQPVPAPPASAARAKEDT